MTILNADIHAEKVSFTSGENPDPKGALQIILRTEGTKETEDSVPAMKVAVRSIWRLWSILVRIAEAVAGVFRG